MLDNVGKVFSVLGILLLILLIAFLVVLLLVLFFPITYKVRGEKNSDKAILQLRVNWLFGFFRVRAAYPDPGKLTAKVLWFTLYDSSQPKKQESESAENAEKTAGNAGKTVAAVNAEDAGRTTAANAKDAENTNTVETETVENTGNVSSAATAESVEKTAEAEVTSENDAGEEAENATDEAAKEGFLQEKISKIKYTFQSIYDKIKMLGVLREEEAKELISHICFRIGKIWKNIRPRHIRAQILFGTGSPDTTGYVFAVYGMLSPTLGPTVSVTPDFTQAVFEGEGSLSGHVTVFVLLIQAVRVLLDKRLYVMIDKFKAGRKE